MDEHNLAFRNPTGATAVMIIGAAMWVCLCLFIALMLTACGPSDPPIETISPAHVVCVSDGVVTLDTVKAAKVYARYTAAIDRLKEMLKTAPKSEYYQ